MQVFGLLLLSVGVDCGGVVGDGSDVVLVVVVVVLRLVVGI